MNSLIRIPAVAVWAAKSTGLTIYTSTVSLLLLIKVPISLSHPLLLVSSENGAYRIQTVFVTQEPPLSSNQCPRSNRTLESLDRLSPRGQLQSSAPIR